MRVYINREPVSGPWGGGNKTVAKLIHGLTSVGHEICYHLQEDIDLIICFDPRPNRHGEWYQHFINYSQIFGTKIIQRVGDVGSHGKPDLFNLLKDTVKISDFLIFPSQWAKSQFPDYKKDNFVIIDNAPLRDFYKYRNRKEAKMSIVTHHWSTNPKKGFEYYRYLDKFIEGKNMSFTYIGRIPEDMKLYNAKHIQATGDNDLIAKLISNSSIYLTASEEEAGANHVLEGMACGLPVVYHSNGGSIQNYAEDYGLSYESEEEMISCIYEISENYGLYKNKVMCYDDDINNVIKKYIELICNIK